MKKVLLVAPYGGVPGGISRWTSHIIDFYDKLEVKNVDLDLVPMGRSTFVNINMPAYKRLWNVWRDYRAIFKDYTTHLNTNNYDLMHLTSSGSWSLFKDLFLLKLAKRKGLKRLTHFHFGRIPNLKRLNNWEWRMVKKVVKASDRVIVLDKQTYDSLRDSGFENVTILANPVAPVVEKVVKGNEKRIIANEILFVGHVVVTKGVFELIDAFKALSKDVRLKMVGHITPEMKSEILNRLTAEDKQRITICGEKPYEEVIKDMMRCDVFVLPTYTEGFPNVILEAMATGCAIVTTPVGAIPQMLEDDEFGKYGILVEPKNADALSVAISSLLDDESLKSELRKNVRSRVHKRYNIQSVWDKMVSIWENC